MFSLYGLHELFLATKNSSWTVSHFYNHLHKHKPIFNLGSKLSSVWWYRRNLCRNILFLPFQYTSLDWNGINRSCSLNKNHDGMPYLWWFLGIYSNTSHMKPFLTDITRYHIFIIFFRQDMVVLHCPTFFRNDVSTPFVRQV